MFLTVGQIQGTAAWYFTKSYISEFSGQFGGVVGRTTPGAPAGHLLLGLPALREFASRLLKCGKRHPVSLSQKAQLRIAANRVPSMKALLSSPSYDPMHWFRELTAAHWRLVL